MGRMSRYLTPLETQEKLSISRACLHRLRRADKDFPKPIPLGDKSIRFVEDEVDDYMMRKQRRPY